MASSIGSVFIDIKADTSHLVKGFDKAEKMVGKATDTMVKMVGAVGLSLSVISFKNLIDEQAELAKQASLTAEQYAITTEELTKYHYVAEKAGVSAEKFNDALKDAGTKVTEFQRDGESAKEAFLALGINQKFAKEQMQTSSKAMEVLLQRFAEFPNGMQKATIAQEIFGDEGANVIRVANLGADAIKRYTEEAIKGNITTSEVFAQKSKAYLDAEHRLNALQEGWKSAVIEESQFLEIGTSMYNILGDAVMEWTVEVQAGNSAFVNGLESMGNNVEAIFPTVIEIWGILGGAVGDVGSAVLEVGGSFVSTIGDIVGFNDSSLDSISTLGKFVGIAMGATMAIENFAGLIKLSANGLEYFGAMVQSKAIANLNSLSASYYDTMASITSFMSLIDDDFNKESRAYLEKSRDATTAAAKAMEEGNTRYKALAKERSDILSNFHSIDKIKAQMQATATAVTLAQKKVMKEHEENAKKLAKSAKDREAEIAKNGASSVKSLTNTMNAIKRLETAKQNKGVSSSKDTPTHTKELKSEARAYEKLKKEQIRLEKEQAKALKEEQREVAQIAKQWETVEQNQKKAFEDYTRNQADAEKTYLSIMGDFEALAKMQDAETLAKIKPYISDSDYAKAKKQLEELTRKEFNPTFADGIADAFNINTNKPLKDSLKDLGSLLGNLAGDALQTISADYSKTGDLQGAFNSYTDSNALRDGLKNSGNPYAMAVGYGTELLSGALSEPMDAFQSMATNIHADNKAIEASLNIVENAQFPMLDVAKKSREHLENIQNSLSNIGTMVAFGGGSFATGAGFEGTHSLNANQDFLRVANGNIGGILDDNIGTQFSMALLNSIIGDVSTSLTDSGITFSQQSATQFANNLDAEQYQIIETKKKYLFGLVKDTSYETAFQDLPQDLADKFSGIYGDGMATVLEQGISLGFDGTDLANQLGSHITEEMKASLKGKSQQEIAEIIGGWFGSEFNAMVEETMGADLTSFVKAGEDISATLTRVSIGFEQANYNLERIGLSDVKFDNIKNSENGNKYLEYLNSDTSGYISNIMSETEQLQVKLLDLNKSFGSVNMSVPKTIEEYNNMVKSLDRNTIEGAKTYSVLMNSASAFASYRKNIEDLKSSFLTDRTSEISSYSTSIISTEEKIAQLQQENADASSKYAQDQLDYTNKIADATRDMISTISKTFEDEIARLSDIGKDDESQKVQNLIKFNDLEQQYKDIVNGGGAVDSENLKAIQSEMISLSNTLGVSENKGMSEALINALSYDKSLLDSTSITATISDSYPVQQQTNDLKNTAEITKLQKLLEFEKWLTKGNDLLSMVDKNFAIGYSKSHELSREQARQLFEISKDGDITQKELGSLNSWSSEMVNELRKDIKLPEIVVNVDVSGNITVDRASASFNGNITKTPNPMSKDEAQSIYDKYLEDERKKFESQRLSPWTAPSFNGGGFTGTGSRSGGVDGIGGFNAILHPNEMVLDLTKMKSNNSQNNSVFREMLSELKALKKELEELKDSNLKQEKQATITSIESRKTRKILEEA